MTVKKQFPTLETYRMRTAPHRRTPLQMYSLETHTSENRRKTSRIATLEEGIEAVAFGKLSSRGDTHFLIQNATPVFDNDEEMTRTVHYPLKVFVTYLDEEGLRRSEAIQVLQNVNMLRFFKPHLESTLGTSAGDFFQQDVMRVANVDPRRKTFISKHKKYSCFVTDRAMDTVPVVVHKHKT